MKDIGEVWTMVNGDQVLLFGKSPMPESSGLEGHMISYAPLTDQDKLGEYDLQVQLNGVPANVDCLNTMGASCNAFHELIGKVSMEEFPRSRTENYSSRTSGKS